MFYVSKRHLILSVESLFDSFFYRKELFLRKYSAKHRKLELNATAILQKYKFRISFATCPRKHFSSLAKVE